ncbi:MAG: PIG-L deacetylase family protein [Anaerolineae bacterium]
MRLHLVLSPHYDDGILSCGGLMARQVAAGERGLILTIFAGDPPPMASASALAASLAGAFADNAAYVAARREEDRRAASHLGVETLHWEYPDCIYRSAPDGTLAYDTPAKVFGEVHAAERGAFVNALAIRIQALCDALSPAVVYAPLSVGHHVDHQIVHWAASLLTSRGWRLRFYEDYTYAALQGALQAALGREGRWAPELELLPDAALEAKMAAIALYESQLPGLFGPQSLAISASAHENSHGMPEPVTHEELKSAMRRQVKAYACSLSGAGPAERYWRRVRP